jgi:hypothetical protein
MSLSAWKLSVVLSLWLLVPRAGLAEPFQRTELPSSLHLLESLGESAYHEAQPTGVRLLAVTGAAALTGTLAAFIGAELSESVVGGFILGAVIGAPLGAWAGGKLVGGRGSYLGALGGAALGAGFGLLATATINGATGSYDGAWAFPISTLLGAIIGYEVSHSLNTGYAATAPRFQPTVAVSPRSAAVGLGGSF